jgi:hypothetical protein
VQCGALQRGASQQRNYNMACATNELQRRLCVSMEAESRQPESCHTHYFLKARLCLPLCTISAALGWVAPGLSSAVGVCSGTELAWREK